MGLGWICTWIVIPVYISALILLLYPHKYLTPCSLRFLQIDLQISGIKVRLISLSILLIALYFLFNFSKCWTHTAPEEYLSGPERLTYVKEERDLALSGVALACAIYSWRWEKLTKYKLKED